MDLKLLKTSDLVSLYSSVIKELKDRSVIRTNNVIGDLGKYLAIDYYNNTAGLPTLAVAPVGTENIDAISRKGDRYSIKSTSGNVTGVFYGLEPKGSTEPDKQKFEYVIICRFNTDYELEEILEMDWKVFLKHKRWHSRMNAWNIPLTKEVCNDCKVMFQK
ncbi:hypothetical protein [Merdimmobilis hominis]|uniref:hypothetical protein n=1 Tax=Merdimmobilis hominis TaxID=2897707 RepID=UPI0006C79EFE|nr:hypothetical protein [Merdimmobilis hominis]PWL59115.1 MAG: hypothetical protein DBY34_06840 [Oscillospiraceae bacterium]